MEVYGLDLSLSGTGLVDVMACSTMVLRPRRDMRGYARLRWIRNEVLTHASQAALVVVEGPTYGQLGQKGHHERAGLWWCVTEALDAFGIQIVVAPPTVLKKYATGSGNAGKDKVLLAAARNFAWFNGDNNAADALWLSAIGYDLLATPVVTLPARNREVLDKVTWPQLETT